MKARTRAIVRGENRPGPNEPKAWFISIASLAQVLSTKNRLLLETIRQSRPASLTELAELSGRASSNLSRTLHTMERYGLVHLNKEAQGQLVPEVPYDELSVNFPIAAMAASVEKSALWVRR